ncbi:hypothetical protein CDAR_61781 [Caerostris darwini]|uniref:Uncharacterized protein n=1 Tax=Caerostris darwini TaxID=1538125 RepID=A0AAV4VJ76_9ARAC|nr:hypothetical protein CDAR_61781 [Caerostris darwini]
MRLCGFEKVVLNRIETFLTTINPETSTISFKDRQVTLENFFNKILEYESSLPKDQSEITEIEEKHFDAIRAIRKLLEPTGLQSEKMTHNFHRISIT